MHKQTIKCFFQSLPPSSTAVTLRGESILRELKQASTSLSKKVELYSYTSTSTPTKLSFSKIIVLEHDEPNNRGSLPKRLQSEVILGIKAQYKMNQKKRRNEIWLISSPPYISTLIITFSAIASGIPYILDIRDTYPQAYVSAGIIPEKSRISKILKTASEKIYASAQRIITATIGIQSEIANLTLPQKTLNLFNGFPKTLLQFDREKHKQFTICFHGVLGYMQDIDTLIQVGKILEPYSIDLVVIGYGKKENQLKDNTNKNIKFLGRLSWIETVKEASKCHVGLCLRNNDKLSQNSFPVKVWEYIGLSMPTIMTPHSEAGAFLEINQCGIQLPAKSPERVANAVLELKANKEKFLTLVNNNRKIAPAFTRENLSFRAATSLLQSLKPSHNSEI